MHKDLRGAVFNAPHGMHCKGGQVLQHYAFLNQAPDLNRAFIVFVIINAQRSLQSVRFALSWQCLLGGYATCNGNAYIGIADSPLPSHHLRGQRSRAQCIPMILQKPFLCLVSRALHLFLRWSSLCLVGSIHFQVTGRLGHLLDNLCSFQTDLN